MRSHKYSYLISTILAILILAALGWKEVFIFKSYTATGYFLIFLVGFSVLFLYTHFIVEALFNLKKKSFRKSFVIFTLLFVSTVVILFINFAFSIKLPAFTENHFRTNIFTGKCNYGGKASHVTRDPWYYKPDCELDKKIEIAKRDGFYQNQLNKCREYCSFKDRDYYCDVISVGDAFGNGPENLKCLEIVDCPSIDCTEYRKSRGVRY